MIRRRKLLPPTYAKMLHMFCVSRFDEAKAMDREKLDFLKARGLIAEHPVMGRRFKITVEGVKSHRENCCKQGMSEEDVMVDDVESKLAGGGERRPLLMGKALKFPTTEEDE